MGILGASHNFFRDGLKKTHGMCLGISALTALTRSFRPPQFHRRSFIAAVALDRRYRATAEGT